jgi:hypothetical protein
LANGGLLDDQHLGLLAGRETSNHREQKRETERFWQLSHASLHGIAFGDDRFQIARTSHLFIHRGRDFLHVFSCVLLRLKVRKAEEAESALPPLLHPRSIDGDSEQPGFGLKLCSARRTGSLDPTKRLQEGVLGEVLTLLPMTGQTVNHMENQFPVIFDQGLNSLGSCFHRNLAHTLDSYSLLCR